MTDQTPSDVEAEVIAQRVATRSALLDAARTSCISPRERIIRVAVFAALVIYVELSKIDPGGVAFAFVLYFLVLYSRDNQRRGKRMDALVELLGLKDGRAINITEDAEQNVAR